MYAPHSMRGLALRRDTKTAPDPPFLLCNTTAQHAVGTVKAIACFLVVFDRQRIRATVATDVELGNTD
mgnify:FL=1